MEEINKSVLGESGEVEVRVEQGNGEMVVVPVTASEHRKLELRHSETDILASQLLEDPETVDFTVPGVGVVQTSSSRISQAIGRNQNREQLIWFGIDSGNLSAALGDRIIVRRDLLESEYVCPGCRGSGHNNKECVQCGGKQHVGALECRTCAVLGFSGEQKHACGYEICVECNGSGWRNGIVIPEKAQGIPVTGVVVSLGPETRLLKLGDRVLHSRYAGHTLEMRAESYTYMRESEVISLLRDLA